MLNHLQATKLLNKYNIFLEGTEFRSADEVEKDLGQGRTFFLKLVSSTEEASHKTEFGYVRLVQTAQELRQAWDEMKETAKSHDHEDLHFILQEARSGHEVMIGAKRDPIFGFQIIFTPEGGKYAEIHAKVAPPSVRIGCIGHDEALAMIIGHPLSPKIMGARGECPVDLNALAEILVNIGRLMDENPDVHAIDLNPVFASPEGMHIVDARIEVMHTEPLPKSFYIDRDLTVFKRPKCALVVLASAKVGSVGTVLLENVMKSVGNVHVMLPTGKGKENLDRLGIEIEDSIPDGCDLLVYAGIPADAPAIVAEFRAKGGSGAVIISSDFAETGNVELEEQLRESANGMPYLGPNGIGVYSTALNTFFIDSSFTDYPDTGGKTAFFSQSGGVCIESFCEFLSAHNVPVNEIFSLGNGSGISFTEMLNSVADNESVNLVVMHLEGGLKEGEGSEFVKALKKASKVKPVIVLPAGLSVKGKKSAASHTGRMTGGADALLAALKQGGAIVAKSEEELRLAICMLNKIPKASEKAVIFTIGGGKGILGTDAAERVGLELRDKLPKEFSEKVKASMPRFADCTQNPFDFTGSVTLNGLLTVLDNSKMLDSPGVFHMIYQVPGATTLKVDGKLIRLTATEAVEKIALAIRDNNLSFVLNICAQSRLAREIERKADSYGIMVTRVSNTDLILGALKLTTDVWQRYPEIEFRPQQKSEDIPTITRSGLDSLTTVSI